MPWERLLYDPLPGRPRPTGIGDDLFGVTVMLIVSSYRDCVYTPPRVGAVPVLEASFSPLRCDMIFSDYDRAMYLRPHWIRGRHDGRHPDILYRLLTLVDGRGMRLLRRLPWCRLLLEAAACLDVDEADRPILCVRVQCGQGRHRSLASAVLFLHVLQYLHARCEIWRYHLMPADALCHEWHCPCREHRTLTRCAVFEFFRDWLLEEIRGAVGRGRWRIEIAVDHWTR